MRQKQVKTLYDEISGKYHANKPRAVSDYTELPAVLALAGDVRGQCVLDAGCGPGRHAKKFLAKGADVTGIDISAEMIKRARAYCTPHGRFFQADFEQAEFKAASFDLVSASLSLMYAREVQPVIEKFSAWLRPAGRLLFSIYHPVRFFQKIADFNFARSRKVWLH